MHGLHAAQQPSVFTQEYFVEAGGRLVSAIVRHELQAQQTVRQPHQMGHDRRQGTPVLYGVVRSRCLCLDMVINPITVSCGSLDWHRPQTTMLSWHSPLLPVAKLPVVAYCMQLLESANSCQLHCTGSRTVHDAHSLDVCVCLQQLTV